jgi:hypothetical protein
MVCCYDVTIYRPAVELYNRQADNTTPLDREKSITAIEGVIEAQ